MHSTRLISILAALVVCLGLAAPSAAGARIRFHVPRGVTPGHRVTVRATGLASGQLVFGLFLQPTRHRHADAYGQLVDWIGRADRHGFVVLSVVWPRFYLICGARHCRRQRWSHRQRVDVYLERDAHPWPRATVRVQLERRV